MLKRERLAVGVDEIDADTAVAGHGARTTALRIPGAGRMIPHRAGHAAPLLKLRRHKLGSGDSQRA